MMSKSKDQSPSKLKEAVEYVTGNLIIVILGSGVLFFFSEIKWLFWLLTALGLVLGLLYSKYRFQSWPTFVSWKSINDAKQSTIPQRLLGFVLLLVIWSGYYIIRPYIHADLFGTLTGIMEIMVGTFLGYFLWLFWLYNRVSKEIEK